jgi:hypothetical protein
MNELPPDVWVPVPVRWRYVRSWDLIVGKNKAIWAVERIGCSYGPGLEVTAVCGPDSFTDDVDPDETVQVLIPVAERDAVELCREELGARLVEQRTA